MKQILPLIVASILIFTGQSNAQDPRFSQFFSAPQLLNPALTGVFDGEYRVNINYRNQWNSILDKSAFTGYAAGSDYRYNVRDDDYAGVGIQLLNQSSGAGDLSRTQAHLNGSYIKQLGGGGFGGPDYYLVAGAQLGLGQLSTNWNKYWFSRQYDPNSQTVNTGLNSGESGNSNSKTYLDFGVGLLWYAVINERASAYFGGSFAHLNTPNISLFEDSDENLYSRWTIHGGGEVMLTPYLSLLPSAYFTGQGPSLETVLGSNLRYSNGDWQEFSIRAGTFARVNNRLEKFNNFESTIVCLAFEFDRWMMGMSYDINFSNLQRVTNSRGSFELALIYTARERKRYRVKCPTF